MKIQLSPQRIAKDHITVWQEPGPEVDMSMDLKALTFRPASLEQIVTFHVLDHLFPSEAKQALKNWYECLAPGGVLFIVVDDFEYVARAIIGGDISVDVFNREHSHAMQFSQFSLSKHMQEAGFKEDDVRIWFGDIPDIIKREHFELVLAAKK